MDVCEGVKLGVMYKVKYDENSGIWTTYLGTFKVRRQNDLKAENKAPITDFYLHGKLLDGPDGKV